jgi:hypothetical protein
MIDLFYIFLVVWYFKEISLIYIDFFPSYFFIKTENIC